MIGQYLAKIGPNMGVAASQAPVGGRGPRTSQKFGHGSYFAGQLLFRKQVSQKIRANPPPPTHIKGGGGGFTLIFL